MATMRAPQHYYYRQVARQHYAAVMGGASSSAASMMLAGETQGLALDFTDSFWQSTTGFYGSARVIDTGTPANNYNTSPTTTAASLLTYTSPSLKMTMGPAGTLRFQAHNLMTRSQEIGGTGWTNNAITVSANAVAAPDGTTTASTLTANAGAGQPYAQFPVALSLISGATYVVTVYAKAGTHSFVQISHSWGSASGHGTFNLSTGAVAGSANCTATIAAGSNGFYKCSVEITSSTTSSGSTQVFIPQNGSASRLLSWTPAGTETVHVWGAHLRRTPSDSTYLATTTAARYALPLEWSSAGVLQGLLVEEARTNLVTYSDDLTNAAWVKAFMTAAKTATGPDGAANSATTLTATSANGGGTAKMLLTSASATRITSMYVKRRTGTGAVYLGQGVTTGSDLVTNGTFDADTNWTKGAGWTISGGVATNAATGANSDLSQTVAVTAGKLYKVTVTATVSAGTIFAYFTGTTDTSGTISASGTYSRVVRAAGTLFTFRASSTFNGTLDDVSVFEVADTEVTVTSGWTRVNTASATGTDPTITIRVSTNGDEIDVALVQHEVGAFVTSPIPTTGAFASRAVDNISLATSAFPWSATAGTLYVRGVPAQFSTSPRWAVVHDGTANERGIFYLDSVGRLDYLIVDGGATQTNSVTANSAVVGADTKAAAAWAANDCAWVLNGSTAITDGAATLPTVTTLTLGTERGASTNVLNGYIKSLLYRPRRTSNADLVTLTT